MNRRNFFSGLAKAAVAFTILPPATTYGRLWKAVAQPVQFGTDGFSYATYTGTWQFAFDDGVHKFKWDGNRWIPNFPGIVEPLEPNPEWQVFMEPNKTWMTVDNVGEYRLPV